MKKTLKAISPLIASILLIVVAVILVTIILAFGKGFTTDALDKTQGLGDILPSDAAHFIFPRAYEEGTIQFTYSPPSSLQGKTISITSYQILELPEVSPITLTTPYTLKEGTNTLPLNCLYEHALSSPDFTIQLITEDNTYITIKQRDAGMVCTSTGDGSEATPKIICSAQDLNAVRENLDWNYALGKDIDLQCFSRQDENGWEPIGNYNGSGYSYFIGSVNGGQYVIKNLYINRPTWDYDSGLFGAIANYAKLENIHLLDVNILSSINSSSYGGAVGGVVGEMYHQSTLKNCSVVHGQIQGKNQVGGLVGLEYSRYYTGTYPIESSFTDVIVIGGEYAGGLVGQGIVGVYNSYSLGDVYGVPDDEWDSIGGFAGQGEIITNCYSIGKVFYESTTPTDRGFASYNYTGSNNFWDISASLQISTGDGIATGKTTTEMKTQSTFTDWDFSTVWAISPSVNEGYPYLRNNPPR